MKAVVITGVSTGIGYALAAELAAHDYMVFGSVRQQADADRVAAALGENFEPLLLDVTDGERVVAAAALVADKVGSAGLAGVVNNAGLVLNGPLLLLTDAEIKAHFDVNVFGTLAVIRAFLPLLRARGLAGAKPGRIVNMSSISGRLVYPFLGAYAASKHALEAMSDALRRELSIYGVDVIVVEPGTTQTPVIDKYSAQLERFADSDFGNAVAQLQRAAVGRRQSALPVAVVARTVRRALESDRPKARYLLPRKRISGWLIPHWLPDRWFDRLIVKRLGLEEL